jgi:phosphohistidine phosphatase
MELYLLRHGVAVQRGTPGYKNDRLRPLTPDGRRRLAAIAVGMKRLGVSFDVIFSSPLVRARETAELIARGLGLDRHVTTSPLLAPDADTGRLLAEVETMLSRTSARVLLVGHEPDLSRLASVLVFGEEGGMIKLRKGGLLKLTAAEWRQGRRARLEFLLSPEHLQSLGTTTKSDVKPERDV